jgi:NitT/TauT family transport system substrate-binding protein
MRSSTTDLRSPFWLSQSYGLRKIRRAWAIALSLLVAGLLALTSCVTEPPEPLNVSLLTHWPGYEGFFLADSLGYYKDTANRMVVHTSVDDQIRAFQNRKVQAAAFTLSDALVLAENVPEMRVVLAIDTSNGADVILGQSTMERLQDLKGKRVGVEASGLGFQMLKRALDKANLAFKDIKIVRLPGSEQERAFKQGEVDAVVTYEPARTNLLAIGAKQLFDSSQIPGEVVDILVVHQDVLTRQFSSLQALVKGWFRAQEYAKTHPGEAVQRGAQRQRISPTQFLESLNGLRILTLEENQRLFDKNNPTFSLLTQELSEVMVQGNLLKRTVEPSSLLDDQVIKDLKISNTSTSVETLALTTARQSASITPLTP